MTGHDGPAWEHGVRWGGLLTCNACTHRHVSRVWIEERPRTKTRFNGRAGNGSASRNPAGWYAWHGLASEFCATRQTHDDETGCNANDWCISWLLLQELLIITIRPGGCEQAGVWKMSFILFHLYLLFFSYWAAGPLCRDNKILCYLIVESVLIFTLWTART